MRLHLFVAAGAVAASAAVPLVATAGGGHCGGDSVVQHIFDMADQDRDGALSRDEYVEAGLERYGVSFEETDANADGVTSMAEYLELYQRHHPADDPSNEGPPNDDDTV
jgi:hypothetical protein